METLKRPWKPHKRLERGHALGTALVGSAPTGTVPAPRRYAIQAHQALAAFRFFTFSLGASLTFTVLGRHEASGVQAVLLVAAGLYNVVRVSWTIDPAASRTLLPRAALALDLALITGLLLLTGGLNSPFLVYSLSPVLTAALLMDLQAALWVAAASALFVSGAHIGGGLGLGTFPSILSENIIALSLLYSAVCLLGGYLPFLANLNWSRRLQRLAQESERQHLRREVHDNVAQTLAFLSLKMKRAESRAGNLGNGLTPQDFNDVAKAVEQSYLAVRDYLDGADEREVDEPLGTRLATAVNRVMRDTTLPVRLDVTGINRRLPNGVEFQLLQIAREALVNAAKHAISSAIWVELNYEDSQVTLRVRDNGIGFSASRPHGHGLNIMTERAAKVGASLTVSSAPQQGTEVAVVYTDAGSAVAP